MRVCIACITLLLPLAASASDPVQDALHSLASDKSPRVRVQSALALGPLANETEVRDALVKALADQEAVVRAAAAKALAVVGPPEAFVAVCTAAQDKDPMVARWAIRTARLILARASSVSIGVRGLVASVGGEMGTKLLQEVVMEALLRSRRYNLDVTAFDFQEQPGHPEARGTTLHVDLEADTVCAQSDESSATVRVVFRVVSPTGFVVHEVQAEATGRAQPKAAPDPDEDEYTIKEAPPDPRILALRASAEAASAMLLKALAGEVPEPGPEQGRHR